MSMIKLFAGSDVITGQDFDEETVGAIHDKLEAELERQGYGYF